jgi:hypothetical protein
MSNEITNTLISALPAARTVGYAAAAAFLGRKLGLGLGCKTIGAALNLLNNQSGDAWNKSGDDYLKNAKKDVFRDLTIVGVASLGIVGGQALFNKNDPEPSIPQRIIKGISDWSRPIGAVGILGTMYAIADKVSRVHLQAPLHKKISESCVNAFYNCIDNG